MTQMRSKSCENAMCVAPLGQSSNSDVDKIPGTFSSAAQTSTECAFLQFDTQHHRIGSAVLFILQFSLSTFLVTKLISIARPLSVQ